MEEPAHEQESTETVVFYDLSCWRVGKAQGWIMFPLTVIEISVPAFCSKDEKATDGHVCNGGECTRPPDERITEKINLFVVLDPEILRIALVGGDRGDCN